MASSSVPVGEAPGALWREPAFLLLSGLILLRAFYLPRVELLPEEAYYWNYAQHLDLSYLDHPPMVAWLIALGMSIGGQTEFGVRFLALGCSLLTSVFAYRLTLLFSGRRAAIMAALLVQLLPFFFMTGWLMTPDAPLTACWAGLLYFLARVFFDRMAGAWLGVGICLGLGLLSKYTIALLGPATLLFLLLDPPSRSWFRHWAPYAAVLLAGLLFAPVIVWNATHHWASFAFQSTGRLAEPARFSLPALLESVLLVLTPVGVFLAGRDWTTRAVEERRRRLFTWVFTLVPLAVFVLFSLTHRVKLNWTGPLWLALVPNLASQLTSQTRPIGPATQVAWRATVVLLAACYLGLFQYLSYGLPGLPYASNMALFPVGWSQMGQALEHQQNDLRRRTSSRVVIVGMDRNFIASEAAFYHSRGSRADNDVTGVQLFNGISLMYGYWTPPASEDGATLLLASFQKYELNTGKVIAHCGSLEESQTHTVAVNGRDVCNYYTRVAHDYHSIRSPKPAPPGP